MTHRIPVPSPRPTFLAAALFALAGALGLSACSSGGDGGGGATTMRSAVRIQVDTGTGIRGLQADLDHDPGFVVVGVLPAGPFVGETCESNVGSNFLTLLCAESAPGTFDAPASVWRLTVDHSSQVAPQDLVFSLDCLASDSLGNTFPVACVLD